MVGSHTYLALKLTKNLSFKSIFSNKINMPMWVNLSNFISIKVFIIPNLIILKRSKPMVANYLHNLYYIRQWFLKMYVRYKWLEGSGLSLGLIQRWRILSFLRKIPPKILPTMYMNPKILPTIYLSSSTFSTVGILEFTFFLNLFRSNKCRQA